MTTLAAPPADLPPAWKTYDAEHDILFPPAPGSYYDHDRAMRAVRFMNNLTHTKGEWAGEPFELRPWQERIVRTFYGTIRADGLRQYRQCFMEVPRKNGKSEIASGVALYQLAGDGEAAAEVYGAANDRDQASLVYAVAAQMVRNDEDLSRALRVIDSRRRILHPRSNSFYVAIPAEASGRHGYNASAVIYDEIHVARNRELYDVLTTSMGARAQPVTFVITTAGHNRQSICYELHDYAVKVRDGKVKDPTFLPVIYAAPDDADWTSEEVWRACNPALGDFRKIDEMAAAAEKAKLLPARQNAFRQLYLCQWTKQAERWIDMRAWDACPSDLDPAELLGEECWIGMDLSSTTDLTAVILVFPESLDYDAGMKVLCRFYLPEENLMENDHRSREEVMLLEQWANQGYLILTEGNVVDYDRIRADITGVVNGRKERDDALVDLYNIKEVATDRWNATQLATQLQGDGLTVEYVTQGFAGMSAPAKQFEKLVLKKSLNHGGNPVLAWMAENVAVKRDGAENIKPVKDESTGRIDGITALLNGLSRVILQLTDRSVYEERGLRRL